MSKTPDEAFYNWSKPLTEWTDEELRVLREGKGWSEYDAISAEIARRALQREKENA